MSASTSEVPFKLGIITLCTIVLKLAVSLHPFSGKGKAPMFGDYEAQRHWMEITVNLPIKDWYRNTTDNDLLYWGLDYPPLTAYHSYLCGKIAQLIDPSYIALFDSRGYESPAHQFFMRISVFVSDCLIYLPAAWFVATRGPGVETKHQWIYFVFLSFPGLMLVDYGHFQYNCVSLGLFLAAVAFIQSKRLLLSAVMFSMAVNFKQMELYHAIPVFFYLLAQCRLQKNFSSQVSKLVQIGTVTLLTFLVIWLPFLNFEDAPQVLRRVFPLNRGIFEDYVANFWCSLNVIVKIRRFLSPESLARVCLAVTSLLSFPCGIHLFFRPTYRNFLLSLVNVSLSFFLFSYHVHEKSILLVTLPVALYSPFDPVHSFWFLFISNFSMLPLFVKDDLVIPFFALSALFCVFGYNCLPAEASKKTLLLIQSSILGSLILSLLSIWAPAPAAYPYLYTLFVCAYSFVHFLGFFARFAYLQFAVTEKAKKKLN